jgi:ABC-type oligopeptide transport system substrate-binding subunit
MKRRSWLSLAMALIGSALLLATVFAGTAASASQKSSQKKGGTLRWDYVGDLDYIDPQLAYFNHTWMILDATQLHLLGFPDKEGTEGTKIRGEAATGLPTISKDGKTYTFKIKKGFLFSDGKPVTAKNFAAALNRSFDPKLQSPAASFLSEVAGGQAVLDGKAKTASGITTPDDYTLVIKLSKTAPDFVARMTMAFFTAIPLNWGSTEITQSYPSAGPYMIKSFTPGRSALVVRNPKWNNNKEPWKSLGRPAYLDQIQINLGISEDASKLRIEKNETDLAASVPPAAYAELAEKYGVNKGRLQVRRAQVLWYLGMNQEQPLFKGNEKLRQAVNWAIDRPQLLRQTGFLSGGKTDQILPASMPGFFNWNLYPLKGVNATILAKAKSLAEGNLRDGKVVFYSANQIAARNIAQVVQYNLKQIGLDVEIQLFERTVQHTKAATRGEKFDMTLEGWGADYPDPANFLDVLVNGDRLQEANNVNISYANDPAFNKRFAEVATMSGDERLKAYSELDRDVSKWGAYAPIRMANQRFFLSTSVDQFVVNPIHTNPNLVAISKK